jgi:hypothetical protein
MSTKHTRRAWFIESRSGTRAPLLLDFTFSSTRDGALGLLFNAWGDELTNEAFREERVRPVRVDLTWAAKGAKP